MPSGKNRSTVGRRSCSSQPLLPPIAVESYQQPTFKPCRTQASTASSQQNQLEVRTCQTLTETSSSRRSLADASPPPSSGSSMQDQQQQLPFATVKRIVTPPGSPKAKPAVVLHSPIFSAKELPYFVQNHAVMVGSFQERPLTSPGEAMSTSSSSQPDGKTR